MVLRHRASLVRQRTFLKSRVRAVLADRGIDVPAALWDGTGRKWLAEAELPAVERTSPDWSAQHEFVAFADKWDLCDVTSYWRILAARRRALRVAAPGRFIVVQAGQMRLIRVHHEPEAGPEHRPTTQPREPYEQQPSRWRARSRAASPGTASAGRAGPSPLGPLGIIY